MSKPLVLITGVTGFLAQHVVAATLKEGYRVRGTIRDGSKSKGLLEKYPTDFEAVVVEDISRIDDDNATLNKLKSAMTDVTYVLHTASPYTFKVTNGEEELLKPAKNGTENVLKAANAEGNNIKKIVITSSFAAITNLKAGGPWRDYRYTEKDWNPTTYEEAVEEGLKPNFSAGFIYSASKKIAEKAAFDFVDENKPNFKIVTLNPPMIYGPTLQESATSADALNTSSATIYNLFSGALKEIPDDRLPFECDVRDVAQAHILALKEDAVDNKRIALCGGAFTWKNAVEYLLEARPALKDRLVPLSTAKPPKGSMASIDTTVAKEELGLKEFITWQKTLLDTVDSLLELEKKWAEAK